MKKSLFLVLILFMFGNLKAQTISITDARNAAVGTVVKVKGIVTNGAELGPIRYIQDVSGGIAAYSSSLMGTVKRGDSIEVTGTTKNYNQLLELDPVASVLRTDSNMTLPNPILLQIDSIKEKYEAILVRFNGVRFITNPGGTFSGNISYKFINADLDTAITFVKSGHPLVGRVIPTGQVDLIGIVSQYHFSNPNLGYQLLLRDSNDIIMSGGIQVISPLSQSNLSQNGFKVSWTTNLLGSHEVAFGPTPALGSFASAVGAGLNHEYTFTGLNPSELIYVKGFSVLGSDTAYTALRPYITQSNSTGNIICYYNHPVDQSISSGTPAIYLHNLIDDTLIKYIQRATQSIDVSIYNFDQTGISDITAALNAAFLNGITVRVIYDGSANNAAISTLNPGIKVISSKQGSAYGIMHNKIITIDANHSNPAVPLVWTGSTNLTDGQINTDANNVIIIQDKSLALAYTLEFNEMFGSTTATPNTAAARFGPDKTDNTPHEFIIGGNRVECYFSPSDFTNDQILNSINSASSKIEIATMLITRSEIASAISAAVTNRNVNTKILVNDQSSCDVNVWATLSTLLGNKLEEDSKGAGIMHHKFLIVDEGTSSDPLVLTGSHNWSAAANTKNDENTLIVHSATIANQYSQAFKYRYGQNMVGIFVNDFGKSLHISPNPATDIINLKFETSHSEKLKICIYDLRGKLIQSNYEEVGMGINTLNIEISSLKPGTYILNIGSEINNYVQKLIVQ